MSYWIVRSVKAHRNGELFTISTQKISGPFDDFEDAWRRWKPMVDMAAGEGRTDSELEILSDQELANLRVNPR